MLIFKTEGFRHRESFKQLITYFCSKNFLHFLINNKLPSLSMVIGSANDFTSFFTSICFAFDSGLAGELFFVFSLFDWGDFDFWHHLLDPFELAEIMGGWGLSRLVLACPDDFVLSLEIGQHSLSFLFAEFDSVTDSC